MKNRVGLAILLILAGCAEGTTVYHSRGFDMARPKVITVDAYQRSAYFVPDLKDKEIRICAEAAPDTFAVLSASLAAKADVKTQAGELSAGLAQSGATIERTQTINLLRESLYRTCERYISGAISKATLVVQAARDQRTMLAVLAIEQLTRTVRPAATMISAGATGAAVSNQAAIDLATAIRKDRDEARATAIDADAKLKVAEQAFAKPGGAKCSGVDTMPEGGDATLWANCKTAEGDAIKARAALATNETRLGQALAMGGTTGTSAGSSTGQGPNGAGGGEQPPSVGATIVVAAAIRDIVLAPAIDETLLFCIGFLEKQPDDEKTLKSGETQSAQTGNSERLTQGLCRALVEERSKSEAINTKTLIDQSVSSYAVGQGGDTAGPVVRRYLNAAGRDAAEQGRRLAIAAQASTALGRSGNQGDVLFDLTRGDAMRNRELFYVIQALERDKAGQSDLAQLNDEGGR